ncbi:MAG TPA: TetR/AcrR family transcriptional regulator [Microbacterium sp.]|uniref:TetR/AcrR family transcriptional regulator n=1 Tax=Microbacterium sp. TaxID=51671 RepID=UPI002CC7D7F1|nr:TetR/AcrR family transcriptional regulator [Microbacterium sp.]HWI31821.1 TetR/AcrR family transcriptional regulator [Microbacterium sp.]
MDLARATYHHGNLRLALIDAGLDLTRTGGSKGLVLRDVTRAVGVSPNAAYRHFADRESLRAAVATRIQADMAERMLALQPPAHPGMSEARARLTAVGLGYISFALAEPGWFDVAFGGPDAFRAGSAASNDAGAVPAPLAFLLDALDGLVDSGELAPAARPGAEWPCWSAVHGCALLALHGPLGQQPPDVIQAAAQRTVDAAITGILS